jgi:molybdenum cofactor guanylyltransferase
VLAVVVLAGGRSRRFGSDKLSARVGGAQGRAPHATGEALLDRVLERLPADAALIVVGPVRRLQRVADFVREDPPYGGPAAALATGLRRALQSSASQFAVLPGDAPYAGLAVSALLAAVTDSPEAVAVGVDGDCVEQPLQLAMGRSGAEAVVSAAGDRSGGSARKILADLACPLVRVRLPAAYSYDIDTPADLARFSDDLRNG